VAAGGLRVDPLSDGREDLLVLSIGDRPELGVQPKLEVAQRFPVGDRLRPLKTLD